MCFVKSAPVLPVVEAPKVERHQADASLTKNTQGDNEPKGYLQNLKTTPVGLEDYANTGKKTLLGD